MLIIYSINKEYQKKKTFSYIYIFSSFFYINSKSYLQKFFSFFFPFLFFCFYFFFFLFFSFSSPSSNIAMCGVDLGSTWTSRYRLDHDSGRSRFFFRSCFIYLIAWPAVFLFFQRCCVCVEQTVDRPSASSSSSASASASGSPAAGYCRSSIFFFLLWPFNPSSSVLLAGYVQHLWFRQNFGCNHLFFFEPKIP